MAEAVRMSREEGEGGEGEGGAVRGRVVVVVGGGGGRWEDGRGL